MPSPANAAQRHKFPKAQYEVKNWSEYDRALQERGSLTVWVTPEAITAWQAPHTAWQAPHTGRRGRSPYYSDMAIETGHLLRLAFWSTVAANRRSPALDRDPAGVSLAIPDHTTFSRRSASLSLPSLPTPSSEPVHVILDSTGLKIYGAGEWQREKHGGRGRRTWRKLHLAVNPDSGKSSLRS